jgi:hypothetical protein
MPRNRYEIEAVLGKLGNAVTLFMTQKVIFTVPEDLIFRYIHVFLFIVIDFYTRPINIYTNQCFTVVVALSNSFTGPKHGLRLDPCHGPKL